jgi:hypothetical protein
VLTVLSAVELIPWRIPRSTALCLLRNTRPLPRTTPVKPTHTIVRIVGPGTDQVERRSGILATLLIVLAAALLAVALALGVFPPTGALGLLLPAHAAVYLWLFRKRYITGGVLFSAALDGFFPLLSLFALALLL